VTALVRWVFGLILAFLLAPRVEANILHSTHEPAARIFGYDSTVRRQLPVRQSVEQADCGWLRPSRGVRKTVLQRGGSVAHPELGFTGKERDGETGLDYFGARYMSAAQGRFTSPDEPLLDQYPGDPQSWNLYGYVRNNPLRYMDLDGRECKDGKDEQANPCFSINVDGMSGTVRKRAAGAAAQGVNGLIGMANFVILAVSSPTMDPNLERSRQIPYIDLQDRSGNANFGAQASQLASAPFLLTAGAIGDLLKAAAKLDRNLLTKAGRALQKHKLGVQGPAASMNQQGVQILEGILSHPQATTTVRHHARFGNILEVKVPGGNGARFSADGKEFIGFIE
jgi:RHS repeat-associated protein